MTSDTTELPKPRTPEVIIFDLDDTLIDWWGSIDTCLRSFAPDHVTSALQTYCEAECWQRHEDDGYVIQRDTWQMHELREHHWPRALQHINEQERVAHMRTFTEKLWVGFFHDVEETLTRLGQTHRISVLSNNPHLEREMQRLELNRWFTHFMSAAYTTPKPHPGAFLDACAQMNVEPACAWYVGDSIKADAHGALAAGLTPVWVDRWNDPWHNRREGVLRVEALGELVELLAR